MVSKKNKILSVGLLVLMMGKGLSESSALFLYICDMENSILYQEVLNDMLIVGCNFGAYERKKQFLKDDTGFRKQSIERFMKLNCTKTCYSTNLFIKTSKIKLSDGLYMAFCIMCGTMVSNEIFIQNLNVLMASRKYKYFRARKKG